ncbi:MAG: Rpn family recombination-promoting nuclease/putative transposase [Deltaproteobacteria bacterium]|nr:Rpn family recombination-promoting nuclease/putative transposase [Deltaproteobacteria bacterium]
MNARGARSPRHATWVDWSTLELVAGDSVDAAMRELRSDLVFRARLRGDRSAEILVLVEHLSRPRRWTPLVMLRPT